MPLYFNGKQTVRSAGSFALVNDSLHCSVTGIEHVAKVDGNLKEERARAPGKAALGAREEM